ncbi:uncharacterized protein EAE97_010580 [Botrytis byssoidea]|uniref:Uncharacterized protein n=1 Tax=Botrytis byssoidea TaxID=139641 RepID=A0A9P5HYV6_9HELO|nr:uncharacterized protein EAE97_010580 [Botrytis byssoidea]KAF7924629.1 hypothetical protein EAE97_010580 [Botrytis byssoidea]
MSTSARNTAELPEIVSRIRFLETYMEENPSLWHKPAYRSAVEETLWKLNGRLTDHIDLKIFQDKEHLENFLGCSRAITSAIGRLGLVAINEYNRELEPQSNVVANAENSSIEQASNPAAELGIYQEEDYILDDNLVTTGSRSSIDRSEDFDHVFTRHSDNQLTLFPTTSLDDSPLNADGSSIADDESHRGKDSICAKTISTEERDKPSQPKKKKKKKSKKKKTAVENSAEEATLTTIETSHSPTLVLPMAKDHLSPAGSTLDRLIVLGYLYPPPRLFYGVTYYTTLFQY